MLFKPLAIGVEAGTTLIVSQKPREAGIFPSKTKRLTVIPKIDSRAKRTRLNIDPATGNKGTSPSC